MSIFISILAFFIIFSLLILVHEFGHFIMAKRADIYVQEFGLGLPPRIFGKKYGETVYSLNAIPFGGFVRLLGEDIRDSQSLKNPRSFVNKSIFARMKVIVAGVVMNFLLAFILLDIGFTFGIEPLIVNGEDVLSNISNGTMEVQPGMLVKNVEPGSFAEKTGFNPGDRILGFETERVFTVQDFFATIRKYGIKEVKIQRNANTVVLQLTDVPEKESGLVLHELLELPRVRVHSIDANSLAYSSGILPGDIILRVNGQELYFAKDLEDSIGYKDSTEYEILRNNERIKFSVPFSQNAIVAVSSVLPQSAAETAGLKPGDEIQSVQGKKVLTFEDVRAITKEYPDSPLEIVVNRSGQNFPITVVPDNQGYMGVVLSQVLGDPYAGIKVYDDSLLTSVVHISPVKYPFWQAPIQAWSELGRLSKITVSMFVNVVQKLTSEGRVPSEVAGPIGIAQLTHVFVKQGFLSIVRFTALLSLSLGVINILPIPALDGGRLLFIVVEIIRGKRANARFESMIHGMGYALLMLLIIMVTFNDIVRIFSPQS
ncbi:RIP metalloprotease RseP [Candidatus Peregrinibacteria bacterium]|nr:RIP metalloprotease RseP [Candidatus Peregrinibacteria bacterium]